MSRKEYGLVLVLAVIAGLISGVMSSRFLIDKRIQAYAIEAEQFRVMSEDGHVRAMLGVYSSIGDLVLYLNDKDGHTRLMLGVSSNGEPYLNLYDANGKERTTLGYTELKRFDNVGSIEKRPVSSLVLFGEDGKVIWKVP